jgi:hypothetical protein
MCAIFALGDGGFMNSCKMEAIAKAIQAEKELCVQDITSFETLREAREARKRKPWYVLNR